MCLEKRNEFICVIYERKERQVHHPISFKRNKESKGDFTRMTRKDKTHFPCVKMRKRVTKKGGKDKERMKRVINIPETVEREKRKTETMRVN